MSHLAAGQKTTRRGLLSARKYANRESSVVQRRINRKKAKKQKKLEETKKTKKIKNTKETKKKTKKTILQDSGPIHMYLTEFLNIGFFCFFDFLGFFDFFVFFWFFELFLFFWLFWVKL